MSVPCACIIARRSISHTVRVADKASYDSTPSFEKLRVVQAQVVEWSRCRRGSRRKEIKVSIWSPLLVPRAGVGACRVVAVVPNRTRAPQRRADCNALFNHLVRGRAASVTARCLAPIAKTNSNLVACRTGQSVGFWPLRMRPATAKPILVLSLNSFDPLRS
jgi:hypothetical protein